MKYNPDLHHRRSIRLKEYDYSQNGNYFVTICTHNRKCLFGRFANDIIELNDAGKMIEAEWGRLRARFENIQLDEYVVMPNHFHGILALNLNGMQREERAPTRGAPTIGDIIGAFKSVSTGRYIDGVKNQGWLPFDGKLWQKNYYEHIVRNESSLEKARAYILGNPSNWLQDDLFVES